MKIGATVYVGDDAVRGTLLRWHGGYDTALKGWEYLVRLDDQTELWCHIGDLRTYGAVTIQDMYNPASKHVTPRTVTDYWKIYSVQRVRSTRKGRYHELAAYNRYERCIGETSGTLDLYDTVEQNRLAWEDRQDT